jgi:hypothetical protein
VRTYLSIRIRPSVLSRGRHRRAGRRPPPTAPELFAAADRALYVAKRQRRSTAVLAHDFDSGGQGLTAGGIA